LPKEVIINVGVGVFIFNSF